MNCFLQKGTWTRRVWNTAIFKQSRSNKHRRLTKPLLKVLQRHERRLLIFNPYIEQNQRFLVLDSQETDFFFSFFAIVITIYQEMAKESWLYTMDQFGRNWIFTLHTLLNIFKAEDGYGRVTPQSSFLLGWLGLLGLLARTTAPWWAAAATRRLWWLPPFVWSFIPIQCLPPEDTSSSHVHWTLNSIKTLQVDLCTSIIEHVRMQLW